MRIPTQSIKYRLQGLKKKMISMFNMIRERMTSTLTKKWKKANLDENLFF